MGERWGHTYTTWLDKHTTPDPHQIVVHTNRGQDVLFAFSGRTGGWDTYAPQAGSRSQFQYVRQRVAAPHEYQLRLLTGEVLVYSAAGRIAELWDTLATPNKVLIAHDGNGQVSTVTDASGKRRLAFSYTGGVLTSVRFQIFVSGAWVQQHATAYGYTGGHLTAVTIGGGLAQRNLYEGNFLTEVRDGAGKTIVRFAYDGAAAGKVVRSDTARGMVGWEYGSSRPSCAGQTVLYFHRGNTASCSADADCGAGFLCGGKTGAGATGICFRGARCLSVASPSHDVVTSITALGPPGEVCEGACLDAARYIWNASPGVLELGAEQDPSGHYTARAFNANGLPEVISYGDPDPDPTNGNAAREVFLFYGDARFPGRVTELRRKSELTTAASACSRTSSTACARTLYTYDVDGKPAQVQQIGYDLDPRGAVRLVTRTTTNRYDSRGRLVQIDGPLAGTDDVTELEYWTSGDPFADGFLQHYKRKQDATTYLVQSSLTFDAWGNPTSMIDADGTVSCQLFDAARGYLSQRREAMAGQRDCTPNAADLVTSYTRDPALRLTKLTRPDGSCMLHEYDARGRLSKTRRRDDCLAASPGDREEYTYSADGLLTKVETFDAAGTVTRRREMTYYDSRRLEKLLNPVNPAKWTGLTYDARGLVSELADVSGGGNLSKTAWTYTADARVDAEHRFTAGTAFDTWNLLFDWIGNQRQVTDGQSIATRSVRDDFGRVVKLESPDLGGFPTLRVHDAAGRLETVTEAFGGAGAQTHSFTHDHLRRPLAAENQGSCLPSGRSRPHPEPLAWTGAGDVGRVEGVTSALTCRARASGSRSPERGPPGPKTRQGQDRTPMRYLAICVCVCVLSAIASCADPETSQSEGAVWSGEGEDPDGEVIVIEGEAPFEPDWEGPGQGTPANTNPGEGGAPGGGGGGGNETGADEAGEGTGGPGKQPNRKECFPEMGEEKCLDCCYYNHDHVDGWKCRKKKKGSRGERRCWEEAAEALGKCQRETCNRYGLPPITTVAP